jgi:hypothetical protein
METVIAVPESQNVPQLLNIEEQHQPGVNDWMTGTINIFHAPENINHLPAGFHTTTLGLKEVCWVICKGQEDAGYGDEQLLLELKVGGLPSKQETGCGILYPEDLIPCTSQDE